MEAMSSMAPAMPARIRGDRRHEQPHQNNHKMDRATHWKPMQGNSKKVLYIISGASCSGKSTLLEAWKADRLDLFGEQRRARSISLGNGKEAVTCVDRIQGGGSPGPEYAWISGIGKFWRETFFQHCPPR